MDVRQILTVVILLMVAPVALAVGSITTFETTGAVDVESSRTNVVLQLSNTDFSDNDDAGKVSNWDNFAQGATNVWNSSGYVYMNITDNQAKVENGWFMQNLSASSFIDGLSSATVTFKYRLIENENLKPGTSVTVKVLMERPGGDNITVYETSVSASSATWTTQENDVTSYINAEGTYKLFLRAGAQPDDTKIGSNIQLGFDDANLSITVYGKGYTENVIEDVESQSSTGWSLGSLLPLIIAAIALISVIVVGFYGLWQRSR